MMSLCWRVIHQDEDDAPNVIRACLNGIDAKWDVIRFDGLHTKDLHAWWVSRWREDRRRAPECRHAVGLNIEPDNWCALSLYDIK